MRKITAIILVLVCLLGLAVPAAGAGIDLQALVTGSAKATYEEACDRIRIANGRGHILATGCDMAAETPYDNILMLSQACIDMAAE